MYVFLGSNLVKLELRCPTIIRDRVYNEVRCGINYVFLCFLYPLYVLSI